MAKKDTDITEIELPEDDENINEDVSDAVEEVATEEDEAAEGADIEPAEEYEEEHTPLSASILRVLAILTIGAGIALWAGPKIAPVLPAGLKPVAEFLSPQADISTQIGVMQADFDARIAKIEAANAGQDAITEIQSALDRLASKNAEIAAGVAAVSNATKALEASIADIRSELTKINARQAMTTENGSVSEQALQEFEDKLTAISDAQKKLNQSQSTAVDAQQDAESKLRLASATSALTAISDALNAGRPFAKPITQLSKMTELNIPAALTGISATGIASASDLQKQLPELARIALRTDAAARTDANMFGKFTAFLKSQVGTRSLEPKTGDGLDAVLSRIEAALDAGDLTTALAETGKLSDPAKQTMANWIASLTQLDDAINAVHILDKALL